MRDVQELGPSGRGGPCVPLALSPSGTQGSQHCAPGPGKDTLAGAAACEAQSAETPGTCWTMCS